MNDDPHTQDPRPTMTERELKWQTHVAGLQAGAAAEAAGIDPETSTTLLDAATGLVLAGFTFPPIHASLLMMLPLLGKLKDKIESLSQEGGQLAALALCLGDPKTAWRLLRAPDQGASFEAAAFEFAHQFTLSDLRLLAAWMSSQMAQLNEGDGKETEPPGK